MSSVLPDANVSDVSPRALGRPKGVLQQHALFVERDCCWPQDAHQQHGCGQSEQNQAEPAEGLTIADHEDRTADERCTHEGEPECVKAALLKDSAVGRRVPISSRGLSYSWSVPGDPALPHNTHPILSGLRGHDNGSTRPHPKWFTQQSGHGIRPSTASCEILSTAAPPHRSRLPDRGRLSSVSVLSLSVSQSFGAASVPQRVTLASLGLGRAS